jgi:hypothetical protein
MMGSDERQLIFPLGRYNSLISRSLPEATNRSSDIIVGDPLEKKTIRICNCPSFLNDHFINAQAQ